MGNLASPLQFATVASAFLWPLAAGVAVVVWSKARAAAQARRVAAMEGQLQALYRAVEAKPVPARLTMVVEALQEGEELAAGPAAKGSTDAKTTARS
jgi:uncharacterized protein HemX